MAETGRRRASRGELEIRLAEVSELLVARAAPSAVVRFACEKWGIGERAGQKYVAQARERLCQRADVDRPAELGKALAGYELIFRRQLTANDLRAARATLDKLVVLLGLTIPARPQVLTLEVIEREIGRLEGELSVRERQAP